MSTRGAWSIASIAHAMHMLFALPYHAPQVRGDLAVAVDGSQDRFDVVICNQVFEHVDHPIDAVKVLHAMLKPGGLLFFSAPFNERFHLVPGDFYR